MDEAAAKDAYGVEVSPEDEQAVAVHTFVRDLFKSAMRPLPPEDTTRRGTEEYRAAADQLIDLMVEHARSEDLT